MRSAVSLRAERRGERAGDDRQRDHRGQRARGERDRAVEPGHLLKAVHDPQHEVAVAARTSAFARPRPVVPAGCSKSGASILAGLWFATLDLEADEAVDDVEDRAEEVEEAVREVRRRSRRRARRRCTRRRCSTAPAARSPCPESSTARQSTCGASPRRSNSLAEHAAGQDVGDVLVAGDHVQPDPARVDGEDEAPARARASRPAQEPLEEARVLQDRRERQRGEHEPDGRQQARHPAAREELVDRRDCRSC